MRMDGEKVKNKGLWKKFFHLVRLAKIPYLGIVFYFLISLSTVYVAVKLPQVNSDVFTGNASVANIAFVIAVELATTLVAVVMLASYGWIGGRIDRNFRDAIWQKILRMEPKYFDTISPNTLLSRMTDDAESMKGFILLVVSELTSITTTVATIAAMTTMNKGLAVVMAVMIPIYILFGFLLGRFRMKVGNRVKFKMANLTGYLSGQLARITVIKSSNREAYETERGEEKIHEYYLAQRKENIADFLQAMAGSAIALIPNTVLLLAGIYMLNVKALTAAGWIVFYSYANEVLTFFSDKSSLWIQVKQYQGNMNRLTELFNAQEEEARPYSVETVEPGDIKFDHVSFAYGEKKILNDASFTFEKNRFTAILGPSGSGKTTILKLIEQIYAPTSGQILQNGHAIGDYKLENWRKHFAYVKQDTPMISGTLRDNILYGVFESVSDAQIMKAAEQIRADKMIESCPNGLDYEVGQFGEKLSGGQKQKVSLLRAFLQNRETILLDEPTASLDAISVNEVLESIRGLIGKRTIILVAHDKKLIRDADSIIVFDEGDHVTQGTETELQQKSEFFKTMMMNDEGEGESDEEA